MLLIWHTGVYKKATLEKDTKPSKQHEETVQRLLEENVMNHSQILSDLNFLFVDISFQQEFLWFFGTWFPLCHEISASGVEEFGIFGWVPVICYENFHQTKALSKSNIFNTTSGCISDAGNVFISDHGVAWVARLARTRWRAPEEPLWGLVPYRSVADIIIFPGNWKMTIFYPRRC